MYRITSKANSPYPIETKQGWVTVPGMGSVIAEMTGPQMAYVRNSGCYEVESVSYDKPPTVKESLTAEPVSERDQIIAELTGKGVEFDGRMGVKKLRKLLDAANR